MVMNMGIVTILVAVLCPWDLLESINFDEFFNGSSLTSSEEVFSIVLVISANTLKYVLAIAEVKTTDTRISSKAYRIFRELFGSIG
jgi:hypothetical protein